MTVVLGSIVAFLIVGSYWSRQGEGRLLVQCALAAVALHALLFITAYQLPRVTPAPFPSREVRVAVELRGMEEEKPIEILSEHRAPIGESTKMEVIESSPSELSVEPTRPDVTTETAKIPEVTQQPMESLPLVKSDPLLPTPEPTTAPDRSEPIVETTPVRPTEELSRTPATVDISRSDKIIDSTEILPPIDPARPEPAPTFAPNELITPTIDSMVAPETRSNINESAPVRPTEKMERQNEDSAPVREMIAPKIDSSSELPTPLSLVPPDVVASPTEPTAPPIDSAEAPAAKAMKSEAVSVRPSETMSRTTDKPSVVRAESPPGDVIPETPEISAAPPISSELPVSDEAMALLPPASLQSATVDAPEVKPPVSSVDKRIPAEELKRELLSDSVPLPPRVMTDTLVTPPPQKVASTPSLPLDSAIPPPSIERKSVPNVTDALQPPSPEREEAIPKRSLLPTPDTVPLNRTVESPARRPTASSITAPDSPTLPRSPSMADLPARPGIDAPLAIVTPLPDPDSSPVPIPASPKTNIPKRFDLDVAMARPEARVERRSSMPSEDSSKLNLKELVPDSSMPPTPVESSINFWDNRLAPNRLAIVYRHGGSDKTERAVNSALDWLAAHQSPDGRWDSDGFDAACPRGDKCDGHAIERESDTGLTGLALLAFLGAGHTHLEATKHRETVRRGLSWLIRMQRPDGDLQYGGRIYCHSMATLALTEAYAMTKDQRLRAPAQRAILWLAAAQHPETGGWRYAPRETGDTSVYGWAVLSLRSARQAKLEVPEQTWLLAKRWIPSISTGAHGGLACYRPGYPPSHAMTAEALFCRQVLGDKIDDALTNEATDYLSARLPDAGDYHIYYWYYGTLSLFQTGGPRWDRWNQRLTATLLETQRKTGHAKGSWEPRTPFGVDGGRIFSTAVSAMCLEVYYRYLPLYEQAKRDNE